MKLIYQNGASSECEFIKNGRKYLYFRAKSTYVTYRVDKETGDVQVKPYWRTLKGLYVEGINNERSQH